MPAVLPNEVRNIIQNLKNGKAAGEDGIVGEILKSCDSKTHRALTYLPNARSKKDIPTSSKDAKVILLHKEEN